MNPDSLGHLDDIAHTQMQGSGAVNDSRVPLIPVELLLVSIMHIAYLLNSGEYYRPLEVHPRGLEKTVPGGENVENVDV